MAAVPGRVCWWGLRRESTGDGGSRVQVLAVGWRRVPPLEWCWGPVRSAEFPQSQFDVSSVWAADTLGSPCNLPVVLWQGLHQSPHSCGRRRVQWMIRCLRASLQGQIGSGLGHAAALMMEAKLRGFSRRGLCSDDRRGAIADFDICQARYERATVRSEVYGAEPILRHEFAASIGGPRFCIPRGLQADFTSAILQIFLRNEHVLTRGEGMDVFKSHP